MSRVVVYGATRNLYEDMKTAVRSLLQNNKVDRVYLLTEDDLVPGFPENAFIINVSNQQYFPEDGPNYKCRWSYMSMMRLALAKMLPGEDKVLWLDCDTIVDGDISELFELDINGMYFAGAKETKKSFDDFGYINTGVLLMNLAEIRHSGIDDKLIRMVNTHELECPDQDAINALSHGRMLFIGSKYNACPFTGDTTEKKIIHFAARNRFQNDPLYRKYNGEPYHVQTLIAMPCMDMVHTKFMCCVVDMEKPEGTSFTVTKNTLIYSARNIIAQNAIKNGVDRVLWLDSDVTFAPDTLIRLAEDMDEGRDFVSGLYFSRQLPTRPVVYSDILWNVQNDGWVETGSKTFDDYPKDSVFEVAGTGCGCVMTSTRLLQKVCEKYGSPFTPLMGMGEDMAFCWRVKQIGEKMYCDSRVKCGHLGEVEFCEEMYYDGR